MNIDISFDKIVRFLLYPTILVFLVNFTHPESATVSSGLGFLDIVSVHQEMQIIDDYSSDILQEGQVSKQKKNKRQKEERGAQKKENCTNDGNKSESEENMHSVKSYQQLKGILEEVDMMVGDWV